MKTEKEILNSWINNFSESIAANEGCILNAMIEYKNQFVPLRELSLLMLSKEIADTIQAIPSVKSYNYDALVSTIEDVLKKNQLTPSPPLREMSDKEIEKEAIKFAHKVMGDRNKSQLSFDEFTFQLELIIKNAGDFYKWMREEINRNL